MRVEVDLKEMDKPNLLTQDRNHQMNRVYVEVQHQ